jgi:hypothetical protein
MKSVEESPSWEADIRSAGKEIPRLYGTRKFITVFTKAHRLSFPKKILHVFLVCPILATCSAHLILFIL